MNPSRLSRIAIHKKQERISLQTGYPTLTELQDDIPVLRKTDEGIVSFIKNNNILYKSIYEISKRVEGGEVSREESSSDGYATLGDIVLQWGSDSRNQDSAYDISFSSSFPKNCFSVVVNRQAAGATSPMVATDITKDKFTVDRENGISGTQTINYIAIGN